MPMRSHRAPAPMPVDTTTCRTTTAAVDPRETVMLGFALYADTRLPRVRMVHDPTPASATTPTLPCDSSLRLRLTTSMNSSPSGRDAR
jgi:hypothetical protein